MTKLKPTIPEDHTDYLEGDANTQGGSLTGVDILLTHTQDTRHFNNIK
jgi:hypothetical protein